MVDRVDEQFVAGSLALPLERMKECPEDSLLYKLIRTKPLTLPLARADVVRFLVSVGVCRRGVVVVGESVPRQDQVADCIEVGLVFHERRRVITGEGVAQWGGDACGEVELLTVGELGTRVPGWRRRVRQRSLSSRFV